MTDSGPSRHPFSNFDVLSIVRTRLELSAAQIFSRNTWNLKLDHPPRLAFSHMLFTGQACFSPSVPMHIRKAWVRNGGALTRSVEDFHQAQFFFCDGSSDPWLNPLLAKSLIVRHAAWVLKCAHHHFLVPVGAYILDDGFDLQRILPIEYEPVPESPSDPQQDKSISTPMRQVVLDNSDYIAPTTADSNTPGERSRKRKIQMFPHLDKVQKFNGPIKRVRVASSSELQTSSPTPMARIRHAKQIAYGSSSTRIERAHKAISMPVDKNKASSHADKQSEQSKECPSGEVFTLPPTRKLSSRLFKVQALKMAGHPEPTFSNGKGVPKRLESTPNKSPFLLSRERSSDEVPFTYTISELLKEPGIQAGIFHPASRFLGMECRALRSAGGARMLPIAR